MNPVQVADLIEQIPDSLTPDEFLVALANKAAEVEREACAKVCEGLAVRKRFQSSYEEGFADGSDVCANAIRARG